MITIIKAVKFFREAILRDLLPASFTRSWDQRVADWLIIKTQTGTQGVDYPVF